VRRAEAELGWTPRVSLPEALRRSFGIAAKPALEHVATATRSAA
jgi:hypothetical protein